jgi:hypothetical protein
MLRDRFLLARQAPRAFCDAGEPWGGKQMNLSYTYQLLAAADSQRHGFIKLRGSQADHEVRLMTLAGLVDASFDDGKEGSFTAINRITAAGHTFLRVFKGHALPDAALAAEPFSPSQAFFGAR